MPLYIYTTNIPDANNDPSVDQGPMEVNTNSINSLIAEDHYGFNDASGGLHAKVRLPVLGAIPTGTGASIGTLYTKTAGESEVFFTPDVTANEYQLTRTITASFAKFGTNTALPGPTVGTGGWTFLPGGLLLQWGLVNTIAASGTATTVTFPISFTGIPFSITIGSITAEGNSPGANNQFVKDGTVSTSQFQIVNSSGSSARKIYYMAIGI